ncbi:MAG TPA: transglycosylase domain-containing protein [Gaiellaceae bacterium]|nr:transglycosylase domain-containing protein [Gaiellaceae bacterium]
MTEPSSPQRRRRPTAGSGTSGGRRRRRRTRHRRRQSRRFALLAIFVGIPLAAIAAAAIAGTVAYESSCDLNKLTPVAVGQNSFVYAADGSVLGAIPAERNRTPVSAGLISPWMAKATVAIEDRRFYQHGGIDPIGIARAVVADVRAGKIVEGGSTITQELVRNLYLSRERTLKRKLIEACLAIKLANHWSKQRILTAYMNEVYYGNHAYGIEAAAETYYSIPAKDLSLSQSAMLAGLPQAPSLYDPFHQPDDALQRRNEVLHAMLVSGDITSQQYATAAHDRNLHLHAGRRYTHIREPYFFSYVEDQLQQEYGANTVRSGGLKVYTTINPALQRAARAAITHVLNLSTDPASAIVSIDPRTGAIRAMVAVTPGKTGNQFNFVTSARRQPGSTFKTVALTTAVSLGMNPFTTDYLSAPLHYQPDPLCDPSTPGCAWDVQTYEHTYAGVESVLSATLQSDNTVYARLSLDVGPQNIVDMAYKLGVRSSPLEAVPSIALGSIGVTPIEMASVYSTLAAGGVYSKPMAITKVVLPNGKVDTDVGWGQPQRERVIPDWVASTVTQVLEQNMLYGTGTGAHLSGHTDAGKTGTTDNYADAWFSGYTPRLEATVWIGYPNGEIPMLDVHGIAVSGPTFPATIWHLYMETAVGNKPDVPFPPALTQPVWTTWRGQYEYSGAYNPPGSTTTGSTTTASTATTPSTSTTAPATTPTTQAPPTTVAPPPATTTEPQAPAAPPPATTETTPPPP